MVDYSKWDKYEVSSDEETEISNSVPKVTRFDKPQSVTFGNSQNDSIEETVIASKDKNSQPVSASESILHLAKATRNGAITADYLWAQSETEVFAIIFVDTELRARDISVTISRFINDTDTSLSDSATHDAGRHFSIVHKGVKSKVILEGCFPYCVLLDEDRIYWELKTFTEIQDIPNNTVLSPLLKDISVKNPIRTVQISLSKHSFISNTVTWWNCFLVGGPVVDVTDLPDRNKKGSAEKRQEFKDVWNTAHAEFLEKIKNKKNENKIPV